MSYFIYILECKNGAYYTGYTTDIKRRYEEHLNRTAKCKYTRSYPPKNIAVCWQLEVDLATVLSLESQIKKLHKVAKQQLIDNPRSLSQFCKAELFSVVS